MDHSLDHEMTPDSGQAESSPPQAPATAIDDGRFAQAAPEFPREAHSDSSRPAEGRMRTYWVWAVCGFLLLAVGVVFGQTFHHEFLGFDDNEFVYENPHVTPGLTLAGLWWALTDGPFGEWYPLTALSDMVDCQLYGLNPAGHYLTNVLLHAASSVLLFLVLLRMTGDLWPSAWVAAVFAIHPLARRIGGLVGRATGRAERAVFHADARCVCTVRRASVAVALSGRRPDVLRWA